MKVGLTAALEADLTFKSSVWPQFSSSGGFLHFVASRPGSPVLHRARRRIAAAIPCRKFFIRDQALRRVPSIEKVFMGRQPLDLRVASNTARNPGAISLVSRRLRFVEKPNDPTPDHPPLAQRNRRSESIRSIRCRATASRSNRLPGHENSCAVVTHNCEPLTSATNERCTDRRYCP